MVRTRTIREAAAYLKAADPGTCLTETAIRTLLREGIVEHTRVGRKYLVTIEALETYLMGKSGISGQPQPKAPRRKQQRKWEIH
ncbi:MAG: helix-turn-helix domain-containing protein [Oscillibacter sp.]|nr:helix-turn-helix domain-containing protein [Oscillibacter sp.]